MSANTCNGPPSKKPGAALELVKRLLLGSVGALLQAVILFASSGCLDWVMAWAFVGVYAVNAIAIAVLIESELIAERAKIKADARGWDVAIVGISKVSIGLVIPLVAGLDMRFGWTHPLPLAVQFVALAVVALGYGLSGWATIANQFFSDIIRIQMDRGHTVVFDGPYRYVRHPGYVGMILFLLATPFLLSSLWALIPGGLTALIIMARTVVEDRTLLEELDGYKEYARRVRYRLLPGVW
jgi:protein-S-isoprenylcysteine O-methyltransferase Ste14